MGVTVAFVDGHCKPNRRYVRITHQVFADQRRLTGLRLPVNSNVMTRTVSNQLSFEMPYTRSFDRSIDFGHKTACNPHHVALSE